MRRLLAQTSVSTIYIQVNNIVARISVIWARCHDH